MPNLIGPDVSFYQDEPSTPQQIDFAKMRQSADYVIVRAGQNLWIDSDFKYNWQKSKEAGLPRGSYYFYDSRATPKQQVGNWIEAIGKDYPECGLWADFEEHYGGNWGKEKDMKDFMEQLKDAFPTTIEIGVYTSYYWWLERVKDFGYWHQYPLWIANYKTTKPLVPKPWSENEWTFWQFTDSGDGKKYGAESKDIDLNYFNGDKAEFLKKFGIAVIDPPIPPEPEIKRRVVIEGAFTVTEE